MAEGVGEAPDRAASDRAAAEARVRQQSSWVDLQLRKAIERGDFEDLPGYGKPLRLTDQHDPDWWVKQLVEREQLVVVPPSVQLRRDDADLDRRLDRLATEHDVRRAVAEFNERVRWALYRPPEGPPVVTERRDPDREVARWRERRQERVDAARASRPSPEPASRPRLSRLVRRLTRRG